MREFISGESDLPTDARPCKYIQDTYYAVQLYEDFKVDGDEFHPLDYLLYEPSPDGKGRFAGYPEYLFKEHYKWVTEDKTPVDTTKKDKFKEERELVTNTLIDIYKAQYQKLEDKAAEDAKEFIPKLLEFIKTNKDTDYVTVFRHALSNTTGFAITRKFKGDDTTKDFWDHINKLLYTWFAPETFAPDYSNFLKKALHDRGINFDITQLPQATEYRIHVVIDIPEFKQAPIEVTAFNNQHEVVDFSEIAKNIRNKAQ